ncbi:MAG: hypothetical protein AVDCRST_MAG18-4037 [uncultured Thermomicrobiales bacterium]|uniref:Uncharacterized protein n=1 Tax=uncultured Thermomicrobiales bacterium TaxID=1645740 RepID=A0A6J4VRJ3_9BACT|nr:MAG: hypothetical protein AVDCRST_MAG18-4037 [uncultured Thermomicrobiales bacterium]
MYSSSAYISRRMNSLCSQWLLPTHESECMPFMGTVSWWIPSAD